MSGSGVPIRAKELHSAMFVKLDRAIAEGTVEYNRFEIMAEIYLEGDVAKCLSMIQLLRKLQTSGHIDVGKYDVLKDLLFEAGLQEARNTVEKEELKIVDVLKNADLAKSAAAEVTVEAKLGALALPNTAACQVGETEAEVRDSAPPKYAASPGSKMQQQDRGLTGNIIIYGNPTNFSVMGDQYSNTSRSGVKGKSDVYRKYCKSQMNTYAETSPCRAAKALLEKQPSVLLVGNSGDGKSSILCYLSAEPLLGYHPVPRNSPEEIEKDIDLVAGTDLKLLFVVDEPFGTSYTQRKLVDDWMNRGKNLEMYLTTHKFVFASRTSVWNDSKIHLDSSPFFANMLDVRSDKLTNEDKQKLLEKHGGNSQNLTDNEMDEIIYNDEPVAYVQCCKLMSDAIKRGNSGESLVELFQRPFSFLSKEIQKMALSEKEKYATLALLMLCGGLIKCSELSGTTADLTARVRERMKDVVDVCECPEVSCGGLQKCAEKLTGSYLVKMLVTGGYSGKVTVYKFSHDSLLEAVTMHYGQLHFGHCLKYLSSDVIVSVVCPYLYEKGEQEFVVNVPSEYYEQVAELITDKVIAANGTSDQNLVLDNPCIRDDEFQSAWIEYLSKTSPAKLDAFLQSTNHLNQCALQYIAQNGADKLVRYMVESPTRRQTTLSCQCAHEREIPCSILGAVLADQKKIFPYLLSSIKLNQGQVIEVVLLACRAGSVGVLKLILRQLHEDDQATIQQGLKDACRYRHLKAVEYLLLEYLTPCRAEKCFCVDGLMKASEKGTPAIIKVIVTSEHRTQVNAGNEDRVSPLHRLAYRLHSGAVTVLLENGADVGVDRWGQTPLHAAMMRTERQQLEPEEEFMVKRREVVNTFLSHRPNITMKTDQWGRTALAVAICKGYTDIVKLFDNHGYRVSPAADMEWPQPNEVDTADMLTAGYQWFLFCGP